MDNFAELYRAIKSGLTAFKHKIDAKLATDANYLNHLFWCKDGGQMNVLNYLIARHLEKKGDSAAIDYTPFITFVISKINRENTGMPLHQAIRAEKYDLAIYLLQTKAFDVNARDVHGRTIFSLALATKNEPLLRAVLDTAFHVDDINLIDGIPYQPVHEAILYDCRLAVSALARKGAQLNNPVGTSGDTPVLLAARLCKIKALHALLNQKNMELSLNVTDKKGHTALDLLTTQLSNDEGHGNQLIKGIAMLLCHGALPPQNKELCQTLAENRKVLLKVVNEYLKSRPALVGAFVARCHDPKDSLHKIMYGESSWGYALRKLFGAPGSVAFDIERLLSRTYEIPERAATKFKGNEPASMLYAEFVRRYDATYSSTRLTNPWSSMRWMIASGKCDWYTVCDYAAKYPKTRTGSIIAEMIEHKAPGVTVVHHPKEKIISVRAGMNV